MIDAMPLSVDRQLTYCLILATVNRVDEVFRFVKSLQHQTYSRFKLIIVDQNSDNRLRPVVSRIERDCNVIWIRSRPGLSIARNAGLQLADGDIVAFPDDDCVYPSELLKDVARIFADNPQLDGITGAVTDIDSGDPLWRAGTDPAPLSLHNVWRSAASVTIFLRREIVANVGVFDTTLGAGSGTPWAAGEETDYMCRCLAKRSTILYCPDIRVRHPNPIASYSESARHRGYAYGRGMGKVLASYRFPAHVVLSMYLRPLAGAIASLGRFRFPAARFYMSVLRGRVAGWRDGRMVRR